MHLLLKQFGFRCFQSKLNFAMENNVSLLGIDFDVDMTLIAL